MKGKAQQLARLCGAPEGTFNKNYDHLAFCSWQCCGNRRRWAQSQRDAMTMQERRAFEAVQEALL